MRFLLDESADYPLASYLRALGHDVTAVVRDYARSMRDRDVLSLANAEERVLITNDADFGELIFRQQLPHAGSSFSAWVRRASRRKPAGLPTCWTTMASV